MNHYQPWKSPLNPIKPQKLLPMFFTKKTSLETSLEVLTPQATRTPPAHPASDDTCLDLDECVSKNWPKSN
jgi:hypothetical protein